MTIYKVIIERLPGDSGTRESFDVQCSTDNDAWTQGQLKCREYGPVAVVVGVELVTEHA